MDLNKKVFEMTYAGKHLSIETSKLAGQTNASVIGRYGDSAILVTAVMGKKDVSMDYFPLRVEYEEKFYAIGKILGSRFMRREGRPSDEAVLAGRLIDRTIRPLFNQNMRREVQVVITTLAMDPEHDLDFLALFTASTALAMSDIPWAGPAAGVKLVQKEGELLINPDNSNADEFIFDTFVAGTKDRLNMIELEGINASEEKILEAFEKAQTEITSLIKFQEKIVKEVGKAKAVVEVKELSAETKKKVEAFVKDKIDDAMYVKDTTERSTKIGELEDALTAHLEEAEINEEEMALVNAYLDEVINQRVHERILQDGTRPDGRALDEVRELYSEVGLFERTHGTGLFTRGATQALAFTTIAPPGQEKLVDSIEFSGKRRFLLHYNFPPYSVGEVGWFRGAGRREIGHGALARKAIHNMIPSQEDFPYTIRVVSEIMSSNGSSSMATVCASTLSLMDAGVPIKAPVAGIAMGIITSDDPKNFKVLTDLQGTEDHFGDADFKVAGTRDGVTAIQMDVKFAGFTQEMFVAGLADAKKARMQILDHIESVIKEPRKELSQYAPLILKIRIPVDKIGELIGPGGKHINGIIEKTGATSIDIEDDGLVFISGETQETADAALAAVQALMKEYAVGDIVEGPIIKILDFGAIVDLGGGKDGMIHVSELKDGFVKNVTDVVQDGQTVKAKVVKVDNGKIGLSLKGMADKKDKAPEK